MPSLQSDFGVIPGIDQTVKIQAAIDACGVAPPSYTTTPPGSIPHLHCESGLYLTRPIVFRKGHYYSLSGDSALSTIFQTIPGGDPDFHFAPEEWIQNGTTTVNHRILLRDMTLRADDGNGFSRKYCWVLRNWGVVTDRFIAHGAHGSNIYCVGKGRDGTINSGLPGGPPNAGAVAGIIRPINLGNGDTLANYQFEIDDPACGITDWDFPTGDLTESKIAPFAVTAGCLSGWRLGFHAYANPTNKLTGILRRTGTRCRITADFEGDVILVADDTALPINIIGPGATINGDLRCQFADGNFYTVKCVDNNFGRAGRIVNEGWIYGHAVFSSHNNFNVVNPIIAAPPPGGTAGLCGSFRDVNMANPTWWNAP